MQVGQVAQLGTHGCIAFPGGTGTENMIAHAERNGIAVWRPFDFR
jgi:hypothetical protein